MPRRGRRLPLADPLLDARAQTLVARRARLWSTVLDLGKAKDRIVAQYRGYCERPAAAYRGPGVPCSPADWDDFLREEAVRYARDFTETMAHLDREHEALHEALCAVEAELEALGVGAAGDLPFLDDGGPA